ncbi:hypothetical protein LSAT2_017386 [Lamellibrachia satsuma]|nr:hypothetical protein LSAT2_017386 [Lamellibrachia satsuma]
MGHCVGMKEDPLRAQMKTSLNDDGTWNRLIRGDLRVRNINRDNALALVAEIWWNDLTRARMNSNAGFTHDIFAVMRRWRCMRRYDSLMFPTISLQTELILIYSNAASDVKLSCSVLQQSPRLGGDISSCKPNLMLRTPSDREARTEGSQTSADGILTTLVTSGD